MTAATAAEALDGPSVVAGCVRVRRDVRLPVVAGERPALAPRAGGEVGHPGPPVHGIDGEPTAHGHPVAGVAGARVVARAPRQLIGAYDVVRGPHRDVR